jgi:hypothetical protein
MNANEAIERSSTHNEIVTLSAADMTPDEAAAVRETLSAECEDNVDANGIAEFWGEGWRVHLVTEERGRTAEMWWAWHDADSSRWSPGDADAATADAEERCVRWTAGENDDGPTPGADPNEYNDPIKHDYTLADRDAVEHHIQAELERLGAASTDGGSEGIDCLRDEDGTVFIADSQEREDLNGDLDKLYLAALKALPDADLLESGFERAWRTYNEITDADSGADPVKHGYTFAAWLTAAGRQDSASEYDLRAAWDAGEDPSEYAR